MVRIDAVSVVADVVDYHLGRDRSLEMPIRPAVSGPSQTFSREGAMSTDVLPADPPPTGLGDVAKSKKPGEVIVINLHKLNVAQKGPRVGHVQGL